MPNLWHTRPVTYITPRVCWSCEVSFWAAWEIGTIEFVKKTNISTLMPRLMSTGAQWTKLSQLMLHGGRVYKNRTSQTLEGILYGWERGVLGVIYLPYLVSGVRYLDDSIYSQERHFRKYFQLLSDRLRLGMVVCGWFNSPCPPT